jgi:membrane associated rhomboid family serine protease
LLPLRIENPLAGTFFATFAIIAANLAAWIFVQGFGFEPEFARSLCELGLIPGKLLGNVPPGTAVPLGRGLACTVGDLGWSTLITSMFMHGGWYHILTNLWILFVFADNVEDTMGPVRFLGFYLSCGIAAALAHLATSPGSSLPMVGASGAISGVMGAYVVLYPRAPVHMLFFVVRLVLPAYLLLLYWFLLQILGAMLQGDGPGVAFGAHIGGFVAGIALLPLFAVPSRVDAYRRQLARGRGA